MATIHTRREQHEMRRDGGTLLGYARQTRGPAVRYGCRAENTDLPLPEVQDRQLTGLAIMKSVGEVTLPQEF
jgi:hypothetical protein